MHSSTVNSQFKNEKATTPQYQKRSVNLCLMLFGSVVFNCEKLNALYKWLSSIDGSFLRVFFSASSSFGRFFSSFDWARAVAFVDGIRLPWFSVWNVLIVFPIWYARTWKTVRWAWCIVVMTFSSPFKANPIALWGRAQIYNQKPNYSQTYKRKKKNLSESTIVNSRAALSPAGIYSNRLNVIKETKLLRWKYNFLRDNRTSNRSLPWIQQHCYAWDVYACSRRSICALCKTATIFICDIIYSTERIK